MKLSHFRALEPICPLCLRKGHEHALVLGAVQRGDDAQIHEGLLLCSSCQREYPIIDGVPILLAGLRTWVQQNLYQLVQRHDLSSSLDSLLGDCAGPDSAWDITHQHMSGYGFDHYGDQDPEETQGPPFAPGGIARVLGQALEQLPAPPAGPMLDLGCALGRTSFELAAAHPQQLVLGLDMNFSLMQKAQQLLRTGRFTYDQRQVGLVYQRRSFPVELPGADRVDFWLADALELPFRPGSFGLSSSLNVMDSISNPYQHLLEMKRVLRAGGHGLLASPFDWATSATQVEHWLGGHSQRSPLQGSSQATLTGLLQQEELTLTGQTEVDGTIRLHARSNMHYRCWVGGFQRG